MLQTTAYIEKNDVLVEIYHLANQHEEGTMATLSVSSLVNSIPLEKVEGKSPKLEVHHTQKEENGIQLFGGECTIRVANQLELRRKAYKNMHEIYSKTGIAENGSHDLWLSIYDALPETTTLVAEDSKGEIGGTLTLVFDSPIGLPADELYKKEIDDLRDTCNPVCEFVSLGTNKEGKSSIKTLAGLFYFGFLYAWQKDNSVVSIITIHSRYERFYCRNFSFEKLGPERNYAKVNGAPTVLLNVSFKRLNRLRHQKRVFPFYMLNYSDKEELNFFNKIENLICPMSDEEFFTFFIEKTDIWEKASLQQRNFIKKVYPPNEANHYGVSRELARTFSKNNTHPDDPGNDTLKIAQR
jgi:hypothetical protein